MTTHYQTIDITGHGKKKEYKANAILSPGHLVELMSTGLIRVHATGGGAAQKMFALENSQAGGTTETAYAASDRVPVAVFSPGDEVMARLYNGETAVIGSLLESQGDGTLRVVDTDASWHDVKLNSIVGMALEAVDMSGSAGVDPTSQGWIRIEIW
jgi:hypothetical protein